MLNNGEKLLYYISSRKKISRYKLKNDLIILANFLEEKSSNIYLWRSIRNLSSLGHVEINGEMRNELIQVCFPSLVRLPGVGKPEYILCGARFDQTFKKIEETSQNISSVEISSEEMRSTEGLCPNKIILRADSKEDMEQLSKSLGIEITEGYPSFDLINFIPSVEDYFNDQNKVPHPIADNITYFDADEFSWKMVVPESFPYLGKYTHPQTQQINHYVYYDASNAVKVKLDLGRFKILKAERKKAIEYDEKSYRLSLPVRLPLPSLYERSLCLCSGEPPQISPDGSTLYYNSIPREIAYLVLEKLGQKKL